MRDLTKSTADELRDRISVIEVVDMIDDSVDSKDWERCRSLFTDEIFVDTTSLAGGEAGDMPSDDLVGAWRTNLYEDKLTHHMRTNHCVTLDGDTAEVVSRGYALNILHRPVGSDAWEVWGEYIHILVRTDDGWKCSGMTLRVKYARGNETARDHLPEG